MIIKKYNLFLESNKVQVQDDLKKPKTLYKPKNLISEICVSMVLINNEFLDNILDKGLKARYNNNSQVFLTDLKNLVLAKNRLNLGKLVDDKFVVDTEISKINNLFDSVEFSIENDWNDLINARITARNIIDKLLVEEKLTEDFIKKVYWIGPNKSKEVSEDIVIETTDGKQYGFCLNKKVNSSKTASFNTLADDIIGNAIDKIHSDEYIDKWNKLVQNWVRIIYENVNKNIQVHIEKFIETDRIGTIGWFEYFNLKNKDPRYKNLGENFKEFNKNIINFYDFMNEVWKNGKSCFMDFDRVYKEWMDKKIFLLNSKILEHLFTESLTKNNINDIKKLEDGFKLADGSLKMKFIKTIVEKLDCMERTVYYLGNNGNSFHQVPSRSFFREFYDDFKTKFDYHVKLVVNEEDENNNFIVKLKLELDGELLLDCNISVKFSGGELSSKLSATYKFEPVSNFNSIILNKMKSVNETY